LNLAETLPVPERGEEYGAEVWARLRPKIGARGWRRAGWLGWFDVRRLATVGALAALVVGAFLAGRYLPRGETPRTSVASAPAGARNRLLLVTLGDHLDRSQRVLTELSNSDAAELGFEREQAEDLLAATRLYRVSVEKAGDRRMDAVLEELEMFLTEAANASPAELLELQRRMSEQGLLFKVRVMEAQVRERQRNALPIQSN
jgi:hypothetical protein